jgi:hypothetical protein
MPEPGTTFLNKWVALKVFASCQSHRKELSLLLEREHTHEEEGAEAMEVTVDGKPSPIRVVHTRTSY